METSESCSFIFKSESPERQHLLFAPADQEPTQVAYGSCATPIEAGTEQPSDRDTIVRDIIKLVESRVVDAGAGDLNLVDSQEYTERSRYYADTIAHRPLGLPALPLTLPRTCGNPVALIDAPIETQHDLQSIRRTAKMHDTLMRNAWRQEPVENLIIQFNQP
ncbi:unnamed protein product [Dicrocoelium dendriticum]|nr:unnamed protein product [Dicrocoelium dendriticum]